MSKVVENVYLPRPEDFLPILENGDLNAIDQKENIDEVNFILFLNFLVRVIKFNSYNLKHLPKKRKHDALEKRDTEVSGSKVIIFPGGGIKTNQTITELLKVIKPYIVHFLDSSAAVVFLI